MVNTYTCGHTYSLDGFRVADMPDPPVPRADMTGLPVSWSQRLKLPYSWVVPGWSAKRQSVVDITARTTSLVAR